MTEFVLDGLALALLVAALAAALAALTARALLAMSMHLAAAGALVSAALLSLGEADGALVTALMVAGLAPLLMLAAMLLSAPAAKAVRKGRPWLALLAGVFAAAMLGMAAPGLGTAAPVAAAQIGLAAFWLTPLLFVAAIACVGVLGFGERGALRGNQEREL